MNLGERFLNGILVYLYHSPLPKMIAIVMANITDRITNINAQSAYKVATILIAINTMLLLCELRG